MISSARGRRSLRAALFVCCLSLAAAGAAPRSAAGRAAHTTLLSSTPANAALLTRPPDSVRLVFSEAVVAELSEISVIRAGGAPLYLALALGARDGTVLIGRIPRASPFPAGSYRVNWRVVSADGHPVSGSFSFTLGGNTDSVLFPPLPAEGITPAGAGAADESGAGQPPLPKATSLLRGLGLGAVMAGVGLLLFGSAARSRRNLDPDSMVTRFMVLGALVLTAHLGAWLYHISPGQGLSASYGMSVLRSPVGRVELARVATALIAMSAAASGHRRVALLFGILCLGLSGAVGHSAAVNPEWAIPAKIVHLIGGSVWLGGLVWLWWTFRRDATAFRIEARRVSFAALLALIAVAASGIVQSLLYLGAPADLLHTDYGRLVAAKAGGLAILALLGGYNRFRLVPNLDDSRQGRRLSRSVMQELVVMLAIILISGILANVPPPGGVREAVLPLPAASH